MGHLNVTFHDEDMKTVTLELLKRLRVKTGLMNPDLIHRAVIDLSKKFDQKGNLV
jgi:hypothetical protein